MNVVHYCITLCRKISSYRVRRLCSEAFSVSRSGVTSERQHFHGCLTHGIFTAILNVQASLSKQRARGNELELSLDAATARGAELEVDLSKAVARGDTLQTQLSDEMARGQELQQNLRVSEERADELEVGLEAAVAKGQSLEGELEDERERARDLESAVRREVARGDALDEQLDTAQTRGNLLERKLAATEVLHASYVVSLLLRNLLLFVGKDCIPCALSQIFRRSRRSAPIEQKECMDSNGPWKESFSS
jgi:hypothetical protein